MKIKISIYDKIICTAVTIFSLFGFGYFFIHLYLLITDNPVEGFVNIHTNNNFDICKHDLLKNSCK